MEMLPTKCKGVVHHSIQAMVSMAIFVALGEVACSQNISGDADTIHMNSNLVVLNATVVDRHDALVSGLVGRDFQVYEDHVLQPIKDFSHEDLPVTVGLVLDNSASMGAKHADVIAAALSFAASSNAQDQIFVVNFNEVVSFGLPLNMPFTDRKDQLQHALSTIRAIGETALYDGIAASLDHLKQGKYDKKVLIVISDGGDNASKHSLNQITEMAKQSSVILYTIGIFDEGDSDQNPGVLKRFARETGGVAYFPASSKEIPAICDGIAHDIRNQYTITYVPIIPRLDGGYRTIEVRASAPGHGRLLVRTRSGYSVSMLSVPAEARETGHE
jgi:VWFA-related protein